MKIKNNNFALIIAGFVLICWVIAFWSRPKINPFWLSSEAKTVVGDSIDKFCQDLPRNVVCSKPLLIAKNRLIVSVKFNRLSSPSESQVISILTANNWVNSKQKRYGGFVFCKGKYYSSYEIKEGSVEFVSFGTGSEICEN